MAKTIRNGNYEKHLTYDSLEYCYFLAKKGKTKKEDLRNKTYKPRKYKDFIVKIPKQRTIEAASFIDRIVHTWLVVFFLNHIIVMEDL